MHKLLFFIDFYALYLTVQFLFVFNEYIYIFIKNVSSILKTKIKGVVYLTPHELKNTFLIHANIGDWLPEGVSPLKNAFIGYASNSKDNVCAYSSASQRSD